MHDDGETLANSIKMQMPADTADEEPVGPLHRFLVICHLAADTISLGFAFRNFKQLLHFDGSTFVKKKPLGLQS